MTDSDDTMTYLAGASCHLFLSPHYDDVALSAGATVAQLADLGLAPETVVVFGAEPDPDIALSPFAAAMHAGWGLSAGDVVASRQAEETAAAAILGASTRILPFRDAIYRGFRYLSDDDLFGLPAPTEETLPDEIITALSLRDDPDAAVRIYAPMGVGRHVDHQLVFRAAVVLAAHGWDVWFYEDTPYALMPDAVSNRIGDLGAGSVEPVVLVAAEARWERKLDAILSYRSQLETIFRQYVGVGTDREEIDSALGAYARAIGAGTVCERFWKMKRESCISGS